MSEYITIDTETTSNPRCVKLVTNLDLASGNPEHYTSRDQAEGGSPLAQLLFEISGLVELSIEGNALTITSHANSDLTELINDITAALKDFFL
jgi:hypothetical protein